MTYTVFLHPRVETSLDEVYTWWAKNRSVEQASRWYNGFVDALIALENNPERCPFAPENPDFPYELRQLNYGLGSKSTHRVLFTIRADSVLVLTVRHLAQHRVTWDDL